jgi:hypothetical protein
MAGASLFNVVKMHQIFLFLVVLLYIGSMVASEGRKQQIDV